MATEQDTDRGGSGVRVSRVLGGFPAVAALAVGVLYTLGALLKASELSHAGLSVRDTLPLVPLQQLLARGMALVFDNLPALLLFGILFVIGALVQLRAVRQIESFGARAEAIAERAGTIRRRLDADSELTKETDAITAEISELKGWFKALDRSAELDPEEVARIDARVTELERREAAVRERAGEWQAATAVVEREWAALQRSPLGRLNRAFSLIPRPLRPLLVLLAFGSLLIATPAYAVGLLGFGLLTFVPPVRRRIPTPVHLWTLFVAWLLIVELAGAAMSPQPLPKAHLVTSKGAHIDGGLIASTGGTWYVSVAKHSFVAVDTSDVISARVESQGRRRARFVYQYLGL